MARIPLGALTTLNLSTHLDPMFTEIYSGAFANFVFSSGNVGLGGTPSNFGANYTNLAINATSSPNIDLMVGGTREAFFNIESSRMNFGTLTSKPLSVFTSGVERVRIDTSGNFTVGGTSTPLAAGGRGLITVNGTASAFLNFTVNGTSVGYVGAASTNAELSSPGYISLTCNNIERVRIEATGNTTPRADNTQTLGSASMRWSTVYAGTGSINTSDAREKTNVVKLTPNEIAAAQKIGKEIGVFKFLSSVQEKGDEARIHVGMTVQRAIEIMEDGGLEPMAYAFICYDEWDADGDTPAGSRYGFRMDEMMAFVCAGQQAACDALEARLLALENAP